jgi:hypothetical protein
VTRSDDGRSFPVGSEPPQIGWGAAKIPFRNFFEEHAFRSEMRFLIILSLLVLPMGTASAQEQVLRPPCRTIPVPQFPSNDGSSVSMWRERELRAVSWVPANCLTWRGRTRLAGALAGTFTFAGGMDRLLNRLGAFSDYKLISYRSHMGDLRPLVHEAGLMRSSSPSVGADLVAKDFVQGRIYGYFQIDSAGRRTTYQMTILERSASRIALGIENTSPISFAFVSLFDPGALQSVLFLERIGPDRWHYYHAIRAGDGASVLALSDSAAYSYRLRAIFNYVASTGQVLEQATPR